MTGPTRRIAVASLGALALACGSAVAAPLDGDMSLGDPKAKVQVIEYASVTCSHCAAFNRDVFPAFKKKYVDTGKVHYILREVPTPPAQVAAAGFLTARCAGKDKYFTVVDAMFRELPVWAESGDALASVVRAGAAGGLSEAQVKACISDQQGLDAMRERVSKSLKDANIEGTPTFVVNGTTVKVGEMTLAELDAAIAQASKR
ncbi:DsbA family protein [Phenylobacterium sp.]|jgi:protein-disulfide isomerase|uniref:DsbA family protein n=1 Tax=Phenylobacterium sp. TaxID=1871053 RepID=UPI0035B3508F